MYWDVTEARTVGPHEFEVTFADGLKGRVKMLPAHMYGVFQKLRDPDVFSRLSTEGGFVSWPGDVDLAPDAMHEAISRDGVWILD